MRLSTQIIASTLVITTIFVLLILVLLFQYTSSVSIASQYVEETQPARAAMEHLLTTIYDDFLLVEEYMLVTQYTDLSEFDELLAHSQEQCEILTDEVEDLIILEKLTDEEVIESYRTAVLVYASWERSRNALLALHKESLATKKVPESKIHAEKERFVELMQTATDLFTTSLEQINEQHAEVQKQLSERTKSVKVLLIVLLITFLAVSIGSAYFLIQRLTKPLDEMSKASTAFTKGNYETRVDASSKVEELSSLQQQLNRVYALIDTTFKTEEEKSKASHYLLPSQYKDILEVIQHAALEGRVLTMKDIKKQFSLTHPTVVSRLKYLEYNGYIEMKKQGRNKCIFEKK